LNVILRFPQHVLEALSLMVFELIIQFVQIIHMNVLQRATLFIPTVIVLKSEELNILIVVYFCDNEDGGRCGLTVTIPRTVFYDLAGGF
jgi:hypothetical protein